MGTGHSENLEKTLALGKNAGRNREDVCRLKKGVESSWSSVIQTKRASTLKHLCYLSRLTTEGYVLLNALTEEERVADSATPQDTSEAAASGGASARFPGSTPASLLTPTGGDVRT